MNFSKLFPWMCLAAAFALSSVSAWYSIVGLAAIFAGAKGAVMLMGGALEAGKLVAASWVRRYWTYKGARFIRSYLLGAAVVLVFITSIGVFGFLSRAHLEQTVGMDTGTEQVTYLENEIASLNKELTLEQGKKDDIRQALNLVNNEVAAPDSKGVAEDQRYAKALRQRRQMMREFEQASKNIKSLREQLEKDQEKLTPLKLTAEKRGVDVGPLKYVSQLVFNDESEANVSKSVRMLILLLIFVFDPLAVLLLLAAQISFDVEYAKTESLFTNIKVTEGPEEVIITPSCAEPPPAVPVTTEQPKAPAAEINSPNKLNLFKKSHFKKPFRLLHK